MRVARLLEKKTGGIMGIFTVFHVLEKSKDLEFDMFHIISSPT